MEAVITRISYYSNEKKAIIPEPDFSIHNGINYLPSSKKSLFRCLTFQMDGILSFCLQNKEKEILFDLNSPRSQPFCCEVVFDSDFSLLWFFAPTNSSEKKEILTAFRKTKKAIKKERSFSLTAKASLFADGFRRFSPFYIVIDFFSFCPSSRRTEILEFFETSFDIPIICYASDFLFPRDEKTEGVLGEESSFSCGIFGMLSFLFSFFYFCSVQLSFSGFSLYSWGVGIVTCLTFFFLLRYWFWIYHENKIANCPSPSALGISLFVGMFLSLGVSLLLSFKNLFFSFAFLSAPFLISFLFFLFFLPFAFSLFVRRCRGLQA